MNQAMTKIIEKCDIVIMPESGQSERNIARVGPMVRETIHSRDDLRKKYAFDKKTIVVSVGGTSSGKFLIYKFIEIIKKINLYLYLVFVS